MAKPETEQSLSSEAYAEAEKRIGKVVREKSDALDLGGLKNLDRIPPLTDLTALQTLRLNGTQVSDLAPLANLTTLNYLDLYATKVLDFTSLAKLTALAHLSLNATRISDLAPLAKLTALAHLSLNATRISDLAPLAKLTALTYLDLDGAQVSDLAPLNGLTAMKRLNLYGTQVSDLAPLANLTALTYLDLNGTHVSDLAPLANLTGLTYLSLYATQVSNIDPLAKLTALTTLYLNSTQVSDLAPLANLTALETLRINGTQVSDLTPLANLTALADGARKNSFMGLDFRSCPLTNEVLRSYALLENPERTIRTLEYLRKRQSLPLPLKLPKSEPKNKGRLKKGPRRSKPGSVDFQKLDPALAALAEIVKSGVKIVITSSGERKLAKKIVAQADNVAKLAKELDHENRRLWRGGNMSPDGLLPFEFPDGRREPMYVETDKRVREIGKSAEALKDEYSKREPNSERVVEATTLLHKIGSTMQREAAGTITRSGMEILWSLACELIRYVLRSFGVPL